jgi:inosine/xanthosine triphosphatase
MKIAVGSGNKIKIEAVKCGFEEAGFTDIEVVGIDVPSGVPEQPFGEEETTTGARNRAQRTKEAHEDADIIVGIESGIMADDCDMAIIVCLRRDEDDFHEHIGLSEKVPFPKEYIEEARIRDFAKVTVGQVMEEAGHVKDKKDPHLTLTGISRTKYLVATVTKLAEEILETKPVCGFGCR